MSQIRVNRLTKAFDGRPAVNNVSFVVQKGEFCVLLGPSGCGKSTTLRLIAGLEAPDSGSISIDGRDVTAVAARDRGLAMVFQSYALFPHLSVADNIVFGLEVRGVPKAERARRLAEVAALTGLTEFLARKPAQLSGGQRQRVALARAVVGEQPVCLMDEPLSNLDAKLRNEMRLEIRALQQRLGITMVYVTHDQIEAMTMADRIILMRDGVIEQDDVPEDLYERPASQFAARFIGAPPMNLSPVIADPHGRRVVVGVRSEHIRLITQGAGKHAYSVHHVEYQGADTILSLASDEGETVLARVPGRTTLRPGERIGLTWDSHHEHRFDAETGLRLPHESTVPAPILLQSVS